MASVRDLKKDLNFVLGDIIDAVYDWELNNPTKDNKAAEKIIDDAINTFDELTVKVNQKDVENKKAHFKAIYAELETKGNALLDRLKKLK